MAFLRKPFARCRVVHALGPGGLGRLGVTWLPVVGLVVLCLARPVWAEPAVTLGLQEENLSLRPGQTQCITVIAHNPLAVAATVPVSLSLHWELTAQRDLGQLNLTVPAGGEVSASFAFPAGPALFGYEVRATTPDAANPTAPASASAFFTVHRNLWQVSMQGDGIGGHGLSNPLTTLGERRAAAANGLTSLNNHEEFFAWAPDDFSLLAPQANYWNAGQTSYPLSKLGLHETIDALHDVGASVSAYAKGQMSGPPAFEFFRTHPTWANAPYNSVWSVQDIKEFGTKSPFNQGSNHWPRAMTDFGAWPIAQAHITQLKEAADEFRFDAVRYDDHLQVGWVNDGYNPMTARNMQQIVRQLRLEQPWFGFGFNWITGGLKGVWARHGNAPTPDWATAGEAGSQIMDEEVGQNFGSELPAQGRSWRDYVTRLLSDRAMTEPYGGKVFVMQNRRLGPVDAAYRNALVLALRLFHTNFDASAPGQLARFATRYAGLLRSDDCQSVPATQLAITSDRPLWGSTMAYSYPLGPGRARIVIHLLNPPENPNLGAAGSFSRNPGAGAYPPAAQGVKVQVNLPPQWKAVSAQSIETATLATTPLAVTADATQTLTIGTVNFWTVATIDCEVPR